MIIVIYINFKKKMQREKQFKDFTGFDFSELEKIKFKSGYQPRNARDYYYHSESDKMYSYYFGDGGYWDIAKVNLDHIKSPKSIEPKKVLIKNDKLDLKMLEYKLSENYKLELEKNILELQIKLEKLKQKA